MCMHMWKWVWFYDLVMQSYILSTIDNCWWAPEWYTRGYWNVLIDWFSKLVSYKEVWLNAVLLPNTDRNHPNFQKGYPQVVWCAFQVLLFCMCGAGELNQVFTHAEQALTSELQFLFLIITSLNSDLYNNTLWLEWYLIFLFINWLSWDKVSCSIG